MKILIIGPNLNPTRNIGGISTVINTIIQYNDKQKYYHYVIGRSDNEKNQLVSFIQLLNKMILFPFILKREKIDLAHLNMPFNPKGLLREFILNLWCRLLKVPVILHLHGGIFFVNGTKKIIYKSLISSIFKKCRIVVVLSEIEKEVLKMKFGHSNTKILSNCVDTSIFDQRASKQISKRPILLFLGRIEKNKGILEIIEVIRLLIKDFDFRFILCGTGPLTKYCVKECKKILGDNFEYKGVISGEIKNQTIKKSDIFILPSYFEGLPIALLETMAAGCVPIVSNVGSIGNVVNHEINGLLVEKQNVQDLYKKLCTILSNPILFKSLSENAKNSVFSKFDVSNYIIKLNEIYDEALSYNSNEYNI